MASLKTDHFRGDASEREGGKGQSRVPGENIWEVLAGQCREGGLSGRNNRAGETGRPDPQRSAGGKKLTFQLLSREATGSLLTCCWVGRQLREAIEKVTLAVFKQRMQVTGARMAMMGKGITYCPDL